MLLNSSVQQRPVGHHAQAVNSSRAVVVTAAAGKGFGPVKKVVKRSPAADGCPCGSGKTYKECCKPQHSGSAAAPSVEDVVRARFCAIKRKDVSFLLKTTHPYFLTYHYGEPADAEPNASMRQLEDDLWNTVDHYDYDRLKIREVRKADDKPDEATVVFSYSLYDKRTPMLDDNNNPVRKVQIEQSKFIRSNDQRSWQFSEYRLAEVPEALARAAEQQAADMAAAGNSSSSSEAAAA